MLLKRWLCFLVVGLCILPATGCSVYVGDERPTIGPHGNGLNQLVTSGDYQMAVAAVEQPGKYLVWPAGAVPVQASSSWLIVVFDIKNISSEPHTLHEEDFQLEDNRGERRYINDSCISAGNPTTCVMAHRNEWVKEVDTIGKRPHYAEYRQGQELGRAIAPGDTARYYIVFDVAANTGNLQFTFNQGAHPTFAIGPIVR